jgi:hypothetical protein
MKIHYLEEPELQFGGARHIDIRFGIMNYGPLDFGSPAAPAEIKLGIVGSKESVEGVRGWLERCRSEIAAKRARGDVGNQNKQPNLFTRFPGFAPDVGFRSTLIMDDAFCRDFGGNSISEICRIPDRDERIMRGVDLFMEEIRYLAQNRLVPVILCAVPAALLEAVKPSVVAGGEGDDGGAESVSTAESSTLDFHDMLKARAMQQYRAPIQIILPYTYGGQTAVSSKPVRKRELQDEATRAWNIHTALYYKAEGVPWRLPRESTELTVCYVGISFYKNLARNALLTSVAQVFNERGEGVVVRGGAAVVSKDDLQPHLPEEGAGKLVEEALARYREVHKTLPARVVIHKSSQFAEGERLGFESGLRSLGISSHDFLSITNSKTKLYRPGKYPPLRGTLLTLDDREMVLYTRGSVDFFETYPGKYIPVPLRVRSEGTDQTQRFLGREILALSKMNWNRTQFDGAEPITLQAARKCSNILRYCSEGRQVEPRYSYYM